MRPTGEAGSMSKCQPFQSCIKELSSLAGTTNVFVVKRCVTPPCAYFSYVSSVCVCVCCSGGAGVVFTASVCGRTDEMLGFYFFLKTNKIFF